MSYEWITPKTDWVKTDQFTYQDYNRIRNNLLYLNEQINVNYPNLSKELDLGEEKTGYANDYYPSEFEAFEDALESFKRIGINVNIGERINYKGNSSFIDFASLNRIEKNCLNWKPNINIKFTVETRMIPAPDYTGHIANGYFPDKEITLLYTINPTLPSGYQVRINTNPTIDPDEVDLLEEQYTQGGGKIVIKFKNRQSLVDGYVINHNIVIYNPERRIVYQKYSLFGRVIRINNFKMPRHFSHSAYWGSGGMSTSNTIYGGDFTNDSLELNTSNDAKNAPMFKMKTPAPASLKNRVAGKRDVLEFGENGKDYLVDAYWNSLPVKTFTLVVDNRNHLFNKDNPYGYAEYIQEQQMIEYNYGYEMSDGSVYTIKGGKVFVKSWNSDDYQATFNCTGKLNFLVGDYYKGQYYKDGISAYDLAENVLIDAGVEDYIIDSSLRKTVFSNPLPICPHNEALQMIANASRSVLYEDRDGNICVVSGTRAEYIKDIFFEGATSYSIPSAIFNDNSLYNYADAEHEYVYADGSLLFLPENETYRQVGYVSDEIADLNGAFTHSHKIIMTFKTEFDLKRVFLKFAVVIPTSVTVVSKRSGSVVDTQSLTNLSITTVYSYDGIVDEIEITFNGASPNQRIHLNSIELDGGVRYNLTYHELKNVPM